MHNRPSTVGNLDGSDMCIAIVYARFNQSITDMLVVGACDGLARHNVRADAIALFQVPGSFELALTAKKIARTEKYDAIICIGAIIRGETAHFDFIAAQTASGIASVTREEDIPIIFCVLTTDTIEQAMQRSGIKGGNAGWNAAMNAIEMVDLLRKIAVGKH